MQTEKNTEKRKTTFPKEYAEIPNLHKPALNKIMSAHE